MTDGPTAETERHTVTADLDGERVDVGLSRLLGISRSASADLIAGRRVRLGGRIVTSKADRLRPGAALEVEPGSGGDAGAGEDDVEEPALAVLHVDADLLVVDKAVGVAVHPSPGWEGPTVLGQCAAAGLTLASSGPAERAGVVHRLDAGTSGVMVLARSEPAYRALKDAFAQRTVHKTYHALVQGHPDPSSGTIDAPIGRHPHADHRMAVVSGGRDSITHYRTLEAHRYASLLEVELETGRTHQIRVHMAALAHPCAGDLTYGADPVLATRLGLSRQWLHAVRLAFTHPATGADVAFTSPYPEDLAHALQVVSTQS